MSTIHLDMFTPTVRPYIPKIKLTPRNQPTPTEPTPADPKKYCQWIEGDARPALYCGKPVIRAGCAWCERHYRVVYRPVPPSKI